MKTKGRTVSIIIVSVIFAVLLVWATFCDFDISKTIAALKPGEYYSTNTFARAIEIFGEIPLYCFLCFAFALVFWNSYYFAKGTWRLAVVVFALIGIAACALFVPVRIHSYFTVLHEALFDETVFEGSVAYFVFVIIVGASIGLLCVAGAALAGKKKLKKMLAFAIIVFLVAASSQLVTQGLKLFNHRVRYRTINCLGGEAALLYTPWYSVNGHTEKYKSIIELLGKGSVCSFPSGHTTAAGITFTLLALPYIFDGLNDFWGKFMLFFVAFAYTGMVAYARILMGAHYLSDVVVGFAVSFYCTEIACGILLKKKKSKLLNEYSLNSEE